MPLSSNVLLVRMKLSNYWLIIRFLNDICVRFYLNEDRWNLIMVLYTCAGVKLVLQSFLFPETLNVKILLYKKLQFNVNGQQVFVLQ